MILLVENAESIIETPKKQQNFSAMANCILKSATVTSVNTTIVTKRSKSKIKN